jgi:hypothetical protein
MVDIQDAMLGLAGISEVRLVGLEQRPHRLQIQATPAAYSRLRTKFLAGELDAQTGVKWTRIAALEGKDRAPAPFQVPFAPLGAVPTQSGTRQVVCHRRWINGLEKEADQALKYLGSETTADMNSLRTFITTCGDRLYVHSNFLKTGCESPTKIATNLPIDLLDCFVNLAFLKWPDENASVARVRVAHTKHAEYVVQAKKVGRRGDEFYAGAMNIRFV